MPRHPLLETKLNPTPSAVIGEDGSFSGYASLFDRIDLSRDRVRPGAFRASLARKGAAGIRMLWQHDPAEPIGVWLSLVEDARGLLVQGRLASVTRAREARSLLAEGALDGLSIGFRIEKASTDPRTGIRDLTEIDLWEISLVTFPMLPDARVARHGRATSPEGAALARTLRSAAERLRSIHRNH
jgi:uncharacterized protein